MLFPAQADRRLRTLWKARGYYHHRKLSLVDRTAPDAACEIAEHVVGAEDSKLRTVVLQAFAQSRWDALLRQQIGN